MPGKSVKDFSLPSTGGPFRLSALRGSNVIKMKNMYGRKVGDKSGSPRARMARVKVPGHAQEVLDFAETL